MGRIWPDLFAALDRENEILAAAAHRARQELTAHGTAIELNDAKPASEAPIVGSRPDPLKTYAALLGEHEEIVIALHAEGAASWAQDARRQLRRDLAAAARVECQLLEPVWRP
jgi:hypothetical protein